MLKVFGIFCLLFITQVVLSGEDIQNPTSTTSTKEKKTGGIAKKFNNQLSRVKSSVTNTGQDSISDAIESAIETDLEQEDLSNEEENPTSTTSTEETKVRKRGFAKKFNNQLSRVKSTVTDVGQDLISDKIKSAIETDLEQDDPSNEEENPISTTPTEETEMRKKGLVGNVKDAVLSGSKALVSDTVDTIKSAINTSVNLIPEDLRPHFITILTLILQLAIPGGIVTTPLLPIVDIVAKNVFLLAKRKGRKNKLKMKPRDTTDIILYTLVAEDVNDDQQLQKLTDLGLESDVVKQVVGSFMKSWKEMVDGYVQNYYQTSLKETIESILKQSETKNDS